MLISDRIDGASIHQSSRDESSAEENGSSSNSSTADGEQRLVGQQSRCQNGSYVVFEPEAPTAGDLDRLRTRHQ
jgi:hypothetical protein